MAARAGYKQIKTIAKEHGKSEEELILAAAKEGGSVFQTAIGIGVTPNAIRNWCQRRGVELRFSVQAELVKVQ